MTPSQIYAWILLAIPEEGGKLQDVIALADGINHAIPTLGEIQRSLGWLKHHDFVRESDRRFHLTKRSRELLSKAKAGTATIMGTWSAVTKELDQLAGEDAPPDDTTAEDLHKAYEAYCKKFAKKVRDSDE